MRGDDTEGHVKYLSDTEKVAPKSKKLKLSLQKPRPGSRLEFVNGDGE